MCKACPTVPTDLSVVSHASGSRAMPDRPVSPYTVWFDEYTDDLLPRVGGKCASLGTMLQAGLPVPPGFAVTTDAYETLRSHPELRHSVHEKLAAIDLKDPVGLGEASREIRRLIEHVPLPDDIATAIARNYEVLCEFCDVEDIPVAVRSSATAEDLPDASFAGQQDTYLWVEGVDAVLDHVKKCWSSIFTDRAIAYRHETGHDHEVISMSVGIQKMIQPRVAGVAFTLNPADGDRSQIAIDASWGFGEAVVSGEVTPDNFLVDKVLLEVTRRTVSTKAHEYVLGPNGGIELVPVDKERRDLPCLTDKELRAVAVAAKRAEKYYGSPQDIEWAIDAHLPDGDDIVLLQSRPETVWSRKPRRQVSDGTGNLMDGIVATLLSPVHTREKAATVEETVGL
jgi:pyruvate, water dikinase